MRSSLRALLLVGALFSIGAGVGGCATGVQKIENAISVASEAKVPRKTAYIAISVVNGFMSGADMYLSLPICGVSTPPCRDPAVTIPLDNAVQTARARQVELFTFLEQHPGQLGPKGLYDALVAASTALQSIMQQYNIKPIK